jgi:hypothetical protein
MLLIIFELRDELIEIVYWNEIIKILFFVIHGIYLHFFFLISNSLKNTTNPSTTSCRYHQ